MFSNIRKLFQKPNKPVRFFIGETEYDIFKLYNSLELVEGLNDDDFHSYDIVTDSLKATIWWMMKKSDRELLGITDKTAKIILPNKVVSIDIAELIIKLLYDRTYYFKETSLTIAAIYSRKIPGRLVEIRKTPRSELVEHLDILEIIFYSDLGSSSVATVKVRSDEDYLQVKMIFDDVGDLDKDHDFLCNELLPIIDYGDNEDKLDAIVSRQLKIGC